MKYFYLLIALLLFEVSNSNAQVIIVQNGTTALTTSTLDSAILLAQPNAYIYLPGNAIYSLGVNINKRINIIGSGYNPDSSLATGITTINGNFSVLNNFNADYSTFTGLFFSGNIINGANHISFTRCNFNKFSFNYNCNNIYLVENIIRGGINGNAALISNAIITKNIILHGNGFNCIEFFNGGVEFSNNIFLANNPNNPIFSTVSNCFVRNNIFTQNSSVTFSTSGYGNIYSNNLFIRPGGFNMDGIATNNIYNESLNNIFINVPSTLGWFSNYNYHLSPNCLGKNAGSDGTDVGIFGSLQPFKDGGVPYNPHFQIVNIPGSTGSNGQLNISIKVQAQSN
ncbi:MAG: hypothetical protein IPO63_04795 [Bacteroidetes bacterium]|nr:hypothetical protein [Bacteroidota bacterium]